MEFENVDVKYWFTKGLTKDLETGRLKLAMVKFLAVLFFEGDHNILGLQP